ATVAYATIVSGGWTINPVTTSASNIRDIDVEADSSNTPHVAWVDAENKGVYYSKYTAGSWANPTKLKSDNNFENGNIDMKTSLLSGGTELIGIGISYITDSSTTSYVVFLGKKTTDTDFSEYAILTESLSDPTKMREVALTFNGSEATLLYTSPGGVGVLSYAEAEYFTSGNTWSVVGSAGTVSDGGSASVERRDPYLVLDSSTVYTLYKYKSGSTYYYRLGSISGTPIYVETSSGNVEAEQAFYNATRTESILSSTLLFAKEKGSGSINVLTTAQAPAGPSISVSYTPVDLGSVLVGESATGSVTLTFQGHSLSSPATVSWSFSGTDWTIDKIEVNGVETTDQTITVPVTGTSTLTLYFTFAPQSAGTSALTLTFTPPSGITINPSSAEVAVGEGVEIQGPAVLIKCTPVDVGEVPVGSATDTQVTITLKGLNLTGDVELAWEASGVGWSVEGGNEGTISVPSSGEEVSLTLNLSFAPERTGISTLSVRFTAPEGVELYSGEVVAAQGEGILGTGGGGGCSAGEAGSLGLALLLIGPAILALRRR
ncbi:MAG: hypothetical protein H5T91_09755, partial [Synergistetes bacterium]|nr:hypothetical protein [Synergistota bacterium]